MAADPLLLWHADSIRGDARADAPDLGVDEGAMRGRAVKVGAPSRRPGCSAIEKDWLGTDQDGARDVLARVIYGTRISILFG